MIPWEKSENQEQTLTCCNYRTIIASNTILTATRSIYRFYESYINDGTIWKGMFLNDIEYVSCKMHFMLLLYKYIFCFLFWVIPSFNIFPAEDTRELAVSILSDLSPDHYRGFMEPLQHCKVKYQLQPRLVDPNIA